jgi:Tfp pilus assembly protein PilW
MLNGMPGLAGPRFRRQLIRETFTMANYNKYRRGFSLVEIMVSMIMLVITIAASVTLYMSAAKLRVFSDNELEAYYSAQAWLDHVRTGFSAETGYDSLTDGESRDLNAVDSILREDYNNWPMSAKPKVNMGDTTYTIEDVDLDSGEIFKKVTVEVKWDELD